MYEKSYIDEISNFPENTDHMIWMKIQYLEKKIEKENLVKNKIKTKRKDSKENSLMYIVVAAIMFIVLILLKNTFGLDRYLDLSNIGGTDSVGALLMMPFCILLIIGIVWSVINYFKNKGTEYICNYKEQSSCKDNTNMVVEDKVKYYESEIERLNKKLKKSI